MRGKINGKWKVYLVPGAVCALRKTLEQISAVIVLPLGTILIPNEIGRRQGWRQSIVALEYCVLCTVYCLLGNVTVDSKYATVHSPTALPQWMNGC